LNDRFTRWQVLVNNLKESGLIPHVSEELTELEALLAEARGHQDRQEHYRSQSRQVTAVLRKLATKGDDLRSRIGANLQGKVGFRNEELIRYGFKPRQLPTRRTKKADETAAKLNGSAAAATTATQGQSPDAAKAEGSSD
jgi:hypothetical protein